LAAVRSGVSTSPARHGRGGVAAVRSPTLAGHFLSADEPRGVQREVPLSLTLPAVGPELPSSGNSEGCRTGWCCRRRSTMIRRSSGPPVSTSLLAIGSGQAARGTPTDPESSSSGVAACEPPSVAGSVTKRLVFDGRRRHSWCRTAEAECEAGVAGS